MSRHQDPGSQHSVPSTLEVSPGTGNDTEDTINLSELVAFALRGKWQILGGSALGMLLGAFLSWQSLPQYQSTALLQVELKSTGLAFQLGTDFLPESLGIPTELEIMQSRMVLGPVVRDLQLHIKADPVPAPLLGRPLAPDFPLLSLPPLDRWLRHYTGHGARVEVSRLEFDGPWPEAALILEARENGHFLMYSATTRQPLGKGQVGELVELADGEQRALVRIQDLQATPGSRYLLRRQTELGATRELRSHLTIREVGRQTGLVHLSVQAGTPTEAARIGNAIAASYQRQHVERRSEQARSTLTFLEGQIPGLRREVEQAEQVLIDFMQTEGTTDLDRDASWVLKKLVELDTQLSELSANREELLLRLTVEHPRIQALDRQIIRLRQELQEAEQHINRLPVAQQTLLGLRRDVQAATEIYVSLLNTAQELEIAQAGIVGSVRVIDPAVPEFRPVGTHPWRILIIATLLGLMGGTGVAFMVHVAGRRVHDPDQLERDTGLPVFGVIPESQLQRQLSRSARQGKQIPPLQTVDDNEPSVEAIRSLNTGLHIAGDLQTRKILIMTGPSPGVGKSFLSMNLGAVMGQGGARVLVIDADIRRRSLEPYLPRGANGPGLTDYLVGGHRLEDVVQPLEHTGLDVISAGAYSTGAYSLMMSARFKTLLKEAAQRYDRVIIDTPPALLFADAATMARDGLCTLIVLKSGTHKMAEVTETIKRLKRSGACVLGSVVNQYIPTAAGNYYGYNRAYSRYRANYAKQAPRAGSRFTAKRRPQQDMKTP
ncbi:polysaccharide biosynthesis tyrosine autokinase [Ectothiorhodospira shaposhnikovii]|uniref:polysaccharide biosynthesis tyrosine autokinase n=1 Tax=Ectothiorhodospira shaposhnikovii TaxID=1054 RepID=UPI00190865BB|nr:polysaccharide biosynthesis tyrosine autokinase [Ectothiorhodospira shaposhnikovii]